MKPRFTHDCDSCRFLGIVDINDGRHDIYVCETSLLGPTLIARFGNDGPEYCSAPYSLVTPLSNPALIVAQAAYDSEQGAKSLTDNGLLLDDKHNIVRKINPWS